MNIRFYPPRDGLTYDEIRRGDIWLYADVRCPHCGFDASVSRTHYVGGPCPRCGGLTSGATCNVVSSGDTAYSVEQAHQEAVQEVSMEVARDMDKKIVEEFLAAAKSERMDVV